MKRYLICPKCGHVVEAHRNPFPTVDLIIQCEADDLPPGGIVLVRRKNPPFGWALPGGFVDYGESLEEAARREAKEETGLDVFDLRQFHAYSDPHRDPRQHNISVVFLARAQGKPAPGDDARDCRVVLPGHLSVALAFDHRRILEDYIRYLKTGLRPDDPSGLD